MNKAQIFYHDIGDYRSREEKLSLLKNFRTIYNPDIEWQQLIPNENGDWINQRNDVFSTLIPLAPEKKFDTKTQSFFTVYSLGTATNRDIWVYNFSQPKLKNNIRVTIAYYNEQCNLLSDGAKEVRKDSTRGNWTRDWDNQIKRSHTITEHQDEYRIALYRPYTKNNCYFDDDLNQERYQLTKLFPTPQHKNLVICITGIGVNKDFSTLIADVIPDLQIQANGQCFPLYWYEERKDSPTSLFDADKTEYIRRDGVSNFIFNYAKTQYGRNVTKEDVFYYVYGFLHNPDYRIKFANDLKKILPRLPLIGSPKDFWTFSKAGRTLADLHLNYEILPPSPSVTVSGVESGFFSIEQMRFPKGQKARDCPDTILYNSTITVSGIPTAAYEYIVNGKSAIEWLMERYAVTVHKESGICNDPNDWAKEHDKPRYILDLLLSVINVSIETVDIVNSLPKIEFEEHQGVQG